MTESRNFGPRESILSDSRGVTRPRAPPRFATPERPGRQRGPSSWPVVVARGLRNLRRGRKSWFPNRDTAARSATASSAEHSARGSTEKPTPGTHWYSARSRYRSRNQVRSRAPLGLRTTGDAVPEEPHHLWPALYEEHSGGLLSQAATLNSSAWCLKVIDTLRLLRSSSSSSRLTFSPRFVVVPLVLP